MKIGFYSSSQLEDKRNWSGTMYKMYEQMSQLGHKVEWIPKLTLSENEEKRCKNLENWFQKIFKRGYNKHINIYKARIIAKKVDKYLKNKNFDVIFVPTAINDFALTITKISIIYLNDANVGQLLNYYPYYSGFGWLSKKETMLVEKKMLKKATINIFSSEWAADYAVNHYEIEREKVKVLKFGANLTVPENWQFVKDLHNEIIFLFLAVDWIRKRGNLAYETLKILKEKGYSVKMQIIGCNPAIEEDWVSIIPFLNKSNPDEFREIQSHLLSSHFLFVPTKADCTPIAFCEAAGYGLPVISTDTGGVSAHVINGYNGCLLSPEAQAIDYVDEIEKLLCLPQKVKEYSVNARTLYDKELNWTNWGKEFSKILEQLQ